MRIRIAVLIALLFATASTGGDASTSPPAFFICESNLGRHLVVPAREKFPAVLEIKLSDSGSAAFRAFTKKHIMDVVQIFVGPQMLLEVRVRGEIDGGRISVSARDGADPTALAKKLDSPPAAPCGPAA